MSLLSTSQWSKGLSLGVLSACSSWTHCRYSWSQVVLYLLSVNGINVHASLSFDPNSRFPHVFMSILTFQRLLHSNSVFLLPNLLQLPPALISLHPAHTRSKHRCPHTAVDFPLLQILRWLPRMTLYLHLNFSFRLYLQVLPQWTFCSNQERWCMVV